MVRGGWRDADTDQVTDGFCDNGTADRAESTATVFQPEKPSQVHSGAVVRNTRIEGLSAAGLPWDSASAFRVVGPQAGAEIRAIASLLNPVLCGAKAPEKRGFRELIFATIDEANRRGLITEPAEICAIDSTGYEAGHTSSFFGMRSGRKKAHYPKLTVVADTKSYLYLSGVADEGPMPDALEFRCAVGEAYEAWRFSILVADAGYDGEHHHEYARKRLGVWSIIPATQRRRTRKPPKQPYRRMMWLDFPAEVYGKRWHCESCFSQDKRIFGSQISARNYESQCRALLLRVLVHDIAILLCLYYLPTTGAAHGRPPSIAISLCLYYLPTLPSTSVVLFMSFQQSNRDPI